MNVRDSILLRVRIIYLVFFIASVAVLGRILVLQTVQGPKYRRLVEKKQVKRDKVLASRGNIIARDGQSLLATSLPLFRLVLDPVVIPDTILKRSLDSLADSLSIFYRQEPPSYYKRLIKDARDKIKKDRYVVINPKFFKYLDRQRML
ncbi:MAG: cell division protein, partial [Flexibacteraceae bacterium]